MKVSMTLPLLAFIALVGFTSCSTESFPEEVSTLNINQAPQAKVIELEIMELINEHRISIGLTPLRNHNVVKSVAFSHTDYMIEVNQVNHDNFFQRKSSLEQHARASRVAENVAYSFNSAQAVVNAWLKSEGHRETIEGDFTDFDISAEQNEQGRWYYTNIFIKR
ncbi:CAP domain-containing protein [Paucihalobacter ruber]|uniref:CAP domain-containing protein n=1 Tax=Paucihalobacter ruber TaxID=2567861 RepID=A0A506PGI4_9FLAO|nr:CAP domain-containing protein [Paucihalobacter ruber]TPV32525.1 CAP domain-containing protein [Paucihalobacter ruber]